MKIVIVLFFLVTFDCYSLSAETPSEQSPEQLLEQGIESFRDKEWAVAEKFFQQVIAQDSPLSAMAQNNLGYLYDQQKRYEEAITAYNEALRLTIEPSLVKQIHYNLAQAYLRLDQPLGEQKPQWHEKAIEHLQFVLEREPDNPKLHLELGMAYFSTANPGGGIEEFGKASQLAKEPRWVWIHEKIRDYYLQTHLLDRAKQEETMIQKMKGETEGHPL